MLNTNYVMLCTYVKTIQKPENTGENAFTYKNICYAYRLADLL